jgi:DNA-binding NarL/FixJ family response regulator
MSMAGKHPAAKVPQASPCAKGHNFFCEEAWAGIAVKLGLSQRQVEAARCVVAGQGDKEIARRLDVSCSTVQTHLGRLYEKLEIQSRVELATQVFSAYCAWRTESPPPTGCPQKTRLEAR